jgi:hypothetical protein
LLYGEAFVAFEDFLTHKYPTEALSQDYHEGWLKTHRIITKEIEVVTLNQSWQKPIYEAPEIYVLIL